MDRLEAMAILVAVVERGSFTAAGRHLNLPLPTVSRKLAELEAHLGARLLTRSTRRLALTEAGDAYVAACKRILDDIGNAERAAAGEYVTAKGELVIAAPIVFGRLHVLPVIGAFLAANPEIDVRLLLSDRNAQLLDDHIDLAVRIGALPDSSLVAVRIGSVRRVVCGSPGYFSAHGVPETPGDLTKMSCVTFDAFGSAASWVFAGKPGERDRIVPIRSRLSVNTAEAALDAAISGVGLTRVLSYQAAPGVRDGTLRVVLEDFEAEPVPVNLLHGAHGQIPLKLRAFIDYAAPRLRARLADRPLNVRDSGTSFVSRCHRL
jgi:DNA-binding transcriptional LysR family regulator